MYMVVRHFPGGLTHFFIGYIGILCTWTNSICQSIHALVDSVLVGTRESRKDQVAAVWVALWNAQLVTVLNGGADAGDIREINLRFMTLVHHVLIQVHHLVCV